jgi:hypothetical protein
MAAPALTAAQQAYYDTLFAPKQFNLVGPTGSSTPISFAFGDTLDSVMSAILATDYTLKGATWALYDAALKKITIMEQLVAAAAASGGIVYLLGALTAYLSSSATEVAVQLKTNYKLYQFVLLKSYDVRYYQNLFAILLRQSPTTAKQVWIHEGAFVPPATLVGDMMPWTTSETDIFVSFTDVTTYTSLFL